MAKMGRKLMDCDWSDVIEDIKPELYQGTEKCK
jgi:hypothetical protein